MAFAGTDQFYDAQFQRQAENYRRDLIHILNDLVTLAEHVRKMGAGVVKKSITRPFPTLSSNLKADFALGHQLARGALCTDLGHIFSAGLFESGPDAFDCEADADDRPLFQQPI